MIIKINELKKGKYLYQEDYIPEERIRKCIDILKSIKYLKAKIELEIIKPIIIARIYLNGEVILASTRSLKEVPYTINEVQDLTFTLEKINEAVEEELIFIKGNEIDFNDYFADLFISSIPYQVFAQNDEYINGDSWEVISEDEYYSRKKKQNNPFNSLKKDLHSKE